MLISAKRLGAVLIVGGLLPLSTYADGWAQTNGDPIGWSDALEQAPEWYGGEEAIRIADNVLLYQHARGGWPKNIDMARVLSEADKDRIRAEQAGGGTTLSNTTIDNGATYTPMRYLARVYELAKHGRFKEGFLRGVDYLLAAQYDNGGWPQYYPIRDGYYEHITFNDDAMIGVMRLLRDVAQGQSPYTFVDPDRRRRATSAVEKGLDVILETQIEIDGRLTAWCAQHHPETLEPVGARSYEHPSISGSESVGIIRYLMEITPPSPEVIEAVQGAVVWFDRVRLSGIRLERVDEPSMPGGSDVIVVADSTAPSMWARFYEIGTNCPIFSGRDGIVRYRLRAISHERRTGYAWLGDWPEALLQDEYPAWQKKWAPGSDVRQVSGAERRASKGTWYCE